MDMHASEYRLSWREQLTLSILWLTLNVQSAALLPIVIPTQILLFVTPGSIGNAQQAAFLSWLATMGALMALFIPPVVGIFSDHTPGRFGRRRPYIVGGTILLALSTLLLVRTGNIWIFITGLALFQISNNGITAAYQSLLPDLVPRAQRGEASGYVGLMTILGNVASLIIAILLLGQISTTSIHPALIIHQAGIYYTLTLFIMIAGVLITIIGVHEAPYIALPATQSASRSTGASLRLWIRHNWIEPWRNFNFTLVFLTRFAVMLGLALFMTFIEYYFANVAHQTNFIAATASVAILALLGAVASAFTLGILSDRMKRAPLVASATACMALAALTFVIAPGDFPLWPLGILFGLGYGAYSSVDWALSIDALPSLQSVGKDLGLWSASVTLPGILAPLLGGLIIALANHFGQTAFGYRLVFATAAFSFVLGAFFVLYVREHPLPVPTSSTARDTQEKARASHHHPHPGWRLAGGTHAGRPRGLMHFWPFWERLTRRLWHVQPVPQAPHGLLAIRLRRFHGRPITLPDGTTIQHHDPVIELHFHNEALLQAARHASPWVLLRMIDQDMQALARWMAQPDFPTNAHAIYGTTLLSRGAPRLGFTLRARPHNLSAWCDRLFMNGLLILYHQQGLKRLSQGTTYGTFPQEVWMSRATLLKRYDIPL